MDRRQNSKLNMCSTVVVVCDKHQAYWSAFAPFADAYNDFKILYDSIPGALSRQSTPTQGTTVVKDVLRSRLQAGTLRVADTMVLYAKLNDKPLILSDAKTNNSALTRMREAELVGFASKMLDIADTIPAADLAVLGLSSGTVAAVTADTEAFTTAIGTPRHKRLEAKEGTKQLTATVEAMMELLYERLDAAIPVLRHTAPEFAMEYKFARVIIDPAYRTRALRVQVRDVANAQAIAGVSAMIMPGKISKQTGPRGGFYINRLAEGDYTMIVSHETYGEKTVTFSIGGNRGEVLHVGMGA